MVFLIQIKEKKMKKNFLKIAALLIAAMLLVVSCSQEVKAPENEDNGLVDAKLNIAYGRDLTVANAVDAENFILEYTTEYQWTNGSGNGYTEGVEGEQTDVVLSSNGKLGWLTPGFWKVTVKAYKKEGEAKTGNPIFEGSTSAYFTSKTSTATIFLEPAKAENNSIEFDFFMQDLGTYDTDFYVKYSISMNGKSVDSDVKFIKTDNNETNEVIPVNDGKGHQSEYKKKVTGLSSGYYTVTVAVYEVKEGRETLKGGVTKGMLLAGNEAKVSGHIEPADYVGSSVNAYFIDVDTELTKTVGNYSDGKVTVTYTLTDNTNIAKYNKDISNITKTYIWNYDGATDNPEQESNTQLDSNNQIVNPRDYTLPGVKNVSCTTIYSKTVGQKTYFWAETKSVQVKIEPNGFTYTN